MESPEPDAPARRIDDVIVVAQQVEGSGPGVDQHGPGLHRYSQHVTGVGRAHLVVHPVEAHGRLAGGHVDDSRRLLVLERPAIRRTPGDAGLRPCCLPAPTRAGRRGPPRPRLRLPWRHPSRTREGCDGSRMVDRTKADGRRGREVLSPFGEVWQGVTPRARPTRAQACSTVVDPILSGWAGRPGEPVPSDPHDKDEVCGTDEVCGSAQLVPRDGRGAGRAPQGGRSGYARGGAPGRPATDLSGTPRRRPGTLAPVTAPRQDSMGPRPAAFHPAPGPGPGALSPDARRPLVCEPQSKVGSAGRLWGDFERRPAVRWSRPGGVGRRGRNQCRSGRGGRAAPVPSERE